MRTARISKGDLELAIRMSISMYNKNSRKDARISDPNVASALKRLNRAFNRAAVAHWRENVIMGQLIEDYLPAGPLFSGTADVPIDMIEQKMQTLLRIATADDMSPVQLEKHALSNNHEERAGAAMNRYILKKVSPSVVAMLREDESAGIVQIARLFNDEGGEIYGELRKFTAHPSRWVRSAAALSYMLKADRDSIVLGDLYSKGDEMVRKCTAVNPFSNARLKKRQAGDASPIVLYGLGINYRSTPEVLEHVLEQVYRLQRSPDATPALLSGIRRVKTILPYHSAMSEEVHERLLSDPDPEVVRVVKEVDSSSLRMNGQAPAQADHHTTLSNFLGTFKSLFSLRLRAEGAS